MAGSLRPRVPGRRRSDDLWLALQPDRDGRSNAQFGRLPAVGRTGHLSCDLSGGQVAFLGITGSELYGGVVAWVVLLAGIHGFLLDFCCYDDWLVRLWIDLRMDQRHSGKHRRGRSDRRFNNPFLSSGRSHGLRATGYAGRRPRRYFGDRPQLFFGER